ncbi:hypothetical protein M514_11084 [Trichuris suis]|uniref:Uncharacterized protein n=1 Tax=Trichuris suis TaxID=68888 RepID=A0A085MS05_9BILA|nr:hypothetical protein M513_11084 [Trichuris suis]KFD60001.1 hypothetical protein M514_11084 [Trichuris suis]
MAPFLICTQTFHQGNRAEDSEGTCEEIKVQVPTDGCTDDRERSSLEAMYSFVSIFVVLVRSSRDVSSCKKRHMTHGM